jgi:hypothetical protein
VVVNLLMQQQQPRSKADMSATTTLRLSPPI